MSGFWNPLKNYAGQRSVLDGLPLDLGGVVDNSSCRLLIAMRSVIDQLCLGLFKPF